MTLRNSIAMAGLFALGCGPGGAAEAVRPEAPTAANALGEDAECRDVSRGAEPLIVDWKAEQRGDLEIAMKDGITVVAYDCNGLKLLTDCKLAGEYGYTAMTRREQVVRLSNADEIKANLPFSGGAVGGEVARGSGLDVGIVLVGKHRTTWRSPSKADLVGSCDGATHYVAAATVGAFVLATASSAKVAAAAELFGAGVSTKSQSDKQTKNQDGDPKACGGAKPDDSQPPSLCGAPVRLALAPILPPPKGDATAATAATPATAPEVEVGCPGGLVMADGKCTDPKSAQSYQCAADNVAECTTQCDKGHAGSCAALGRSLARAGKDAEAVPRLEKACEGGDAEGCGVYASLLREGRGVTRDEAKAGTLATRACEGGSSTGCLGAGLAAQASEPEQALRYFTRACDGGHANGCAEAAKATTGPTALKLHERACHGGVDSSCMPVASAYESGTAGLGKNTILAQMLYRRACFRNNAAACLHLGLLELETQRDQGQRTLKRACMMRETLACAALNVAFGEKNPAMVEPTRKMALQKACTEGNVKDCALLGVADKAMNMPMGAQRLDQACKRGLKLACELQKSP
ncbi:MAG: sel1 repeat family protein [Polyangiaceae bacterium]|nr:sel1 repeat family protein [Polyangiaceae bacterium]